MAIIKCWSREKFNIEDKTNCIEGLSLPCYKSLLPQLFYLTMFRYKLEPVLRYEKIGCSTCREWMSPLDRWTPWHIWNVCLDIVCVYICLFAFFWHSHCPKFWYREGPLTLELRGSKCQIIFKVRKNGQQKTYNWQHCSRTSWIALPPTKKKPSNLVKRATSLFSFFSNVAKQVELFITES